MRRALLVTVLALGVLGLTAQGAAAHPLGNFSVNHLAKVKVSSDRVDVHYVLDQAEIPTFQERDEPRSELLASKQAEVTRGLTLRVNGREVPLRLASPGRLTMPRGQGGLFTTRLELSLSAVVEDPHRVQLRDRTFPGRVGWKAIVAEPGEGTAVRADAPSGDHRDLHSFPTRRSSDLSACISRRPTPAGRTWTAGSSCATARRWSANAEIGRAHV